MRLRRSVNAGPDNRVMQRTYVLGDARRSRHKPPIHACVRTYAPACHIMCTYVRAGVPHFANTWWFLRLCCASPVLAAGAHMPTGVHLLSMHLHICTHDDACIIDRIA